MTRGLKFSEAFWDSDITGTLGWDRLCKRMKDGRNVCSSVLQYIKERAKAETDYSKALSNISRKADGKEETGDLGISWRDLKAQTERIASFHEEAAKHFNALADELSKFSDEQKREKTKTEDNTKKYIQSKRNEYQKTMNAKKAYESKCVDFDDAEVSLNTLKSSVTTKKNDLEKAARNKDKAKESRNSADTSYRSAINTLESVRQIWEEQTAAACNTMEDLEVKRIERLRDILWRCANVDSITCVGHDDCSEKVRLTLENCDVQKDIQDFIDNNATGSVRPAPVEYESYYKSQEPQSHKPTNRAPMPALGRPPQLPPASTRPNANIDEGAYASVSMTGQCKVYLKVVRNHLTVGSPSELQVTVGETLEFIGRSKENMLKVKTCTDKHRVGLIPESCVVPMT